jgi:16S rRNA (adenine1518-N6/adenine1519-N6)-dimethyltransferase
MLDGGARVTAVEVDRRIADYLTDTFGGNDAFRLHLGDVLETDLARVAPEARRLIANLPYSITGPVLSLLIDAPDRFDRCVLMVQREVGARLTASRGKGLGAPSVMLQLLYEVRKCFDVGKGAFLPPPDIVSTVLCLDRRPGQRLPIGLRDAVNVAYRQRRKMVRKTLAGVVAPEADLADALTALGLPDTARPEDLPPTVWPGFLRRAGGAS